MNDFNITLFEACEYLNKSKKSISRYIRKGLLHPKRIKSQQGTLEYRFSKADLEAFKAQEAEQSGQDTPQETSQYSPEQTRQDEKAKAEQATPKAIASKKKPAKKSLAIKKEDETRQDTPDKTRKDETVQTSQDQPRQTRRDNEVIELLKETTGMLREQLGKKDEQISSLSQTVDQLIQRDRETNVLLKGLQDKVYMLGQGKPEAINDTEQTVLNGDKRYDYHTKPEETETRQGKPEETEQTTEQVKTKSDKTGQDDKKESLWQRLLEWYKRDV